GTVVPRDRVIDVLWGESPPESAVQSVQVYVHGVRRALGAERIETAGTGYRIRLEEGELDLHRVERLVERGRRALESDEPEDAAEALQLSLSLWRGPVLADLPHEAREATGVDRLEELRLTALELGNDAELACGRHEALVGTIQPAVYEHPYRE